MHPTSMSRQERPSSAGGEHPPPNSHLRSSRDDPPSRRIVTYEASNQRQFVPRKPLDYEEGESI